MSVDLPMPGSPPTRTEEPRISPPPRTRFISAIAVSMRMPCFVSMEDRGIGSAVFPSFGAAPRAGPAPRRSHGRCSTCRIPGSGPATSAPGARTLNIRKAISTLPLAVPPSEDRCRPLRCQRGDPHGGAARVLRPRCVCTPARTMLRAQDTTVRYEGHTARFAHHSRPGRHGGRLSRPLPHLLERLRPPGGEHRPERRRHEVGRQRGTRLLPVRRGARQDHPGCRGHLPAADMVGEDAGVGHLSIDVEFDTPGRSALPFPGGPCRAGRAGGSRLLPW